MPFNFSRIFGPLTAHQYINRVKMAGVVAFPLTFFYATYSNKSLDVQPILDTRLSPLYVEGYVDMWNEQSSLLKPYWAEGEKRNALTEEQKIELDFLKSLRWSLKQKGTVNNSYLPDMLEGTVQLDKTSSFFSV